MRTNPFYKRKWVFLLLAILLATVPLFIQSCSSGYSDPKASVASSSVIINPATLNGWVTSGYATDSSGFNKIVVLDVASSTGVSSYTVSGHVPGALLMDTAVSLSAPRFGGVSTVATDVVTESTMNSLIQSTGIDANTVVVLTGDSLLNVGKAYFNFRYWGFPKNRLKVLDRTNAAYKTAGYALTNAITPVAAASTYSICDLTQDTSLHAPLSEMITVAQGGVPNSFVWDVRTPNEYNGVAGSTLGPTGTAAAGYTAFEGHITGAINLNYTVNLSSDQSTLLDPGTISANLSSIGITPAKTTYVY
jgi:3-mercaptopyruvate sulfurtransferase SseA